MCEGWRDNVGGLVEKMWGRDDVESGGLGRR